ncbi:MAG: PEP-CTERM sorting domain-containing protein [Gammaproteobacteria bacterium]|nr:PEP-CTERM sorting domain-containing protein [Gammaproteobacteria bacterium]
MCTDRNLLHRGKTAITLKIESLALAVCATTLISVSSAQASSVPYTIEQTVQPSDDTHYSRNNLGRTTADDKKNSHKTGTGNNKGGSDELKHDYLSLKPDDRGSSSDKHEVDDSEWDHISIDWKNRDSWKFPRSDSDAKSHKEDHNNFSWLFDDDSKGDKHERKHRRHHHDHWDKGDYCPQAAPVPVPASVWLFGSGLLGLMGMVRRRRIF